MASKTDMLIAKALSTDSEDEAIACLKMARKQGASHTAVSTDKSTQDWEALARKYHKIAYENQEDLKRTKAALKSLMISKTVHAAYNSLQENDAAKLRKQLSAAKNETYKWKMVSFGILCFCIFLTFLI